MTTRIKLRRDTAANWTANNPILALGEAGIETDHNNIKYGDGITPWNDLDYPAAIKAREQGGFITEIGLQPSEYPFQDQWLASVAVDDDGNSYYVGGYEEDDGTWWDRNMVVKLNPLGGVEWQRRLQVTEGDEGHGTSITIDPTNGQLITVNEFYTNTNSTWVYSPVIIRLDPATGDIVGYPTVIEDALKISESEGGGDIGEIYINAVTLDNDGNTIVAGSKYGDQKLIPVTPLLGSTGSLLIVSSSTFTTAEYPRESGYDSAWWIKGTDLVNKTYINNVNTFQNISGTVNAESSGSGATFNFYYNNKVAQVATGNSYGTNYQPGDVITIPADQINGLTSATITVVNVYGDGGIQYRDYGYDQTDWTYTYQPDKSKIYLNVNDNDVAFESTGTWTIIHNYNSNAFVWSPNSGTPWNLTIGDSRYDHFDTVAVDSNNNIYAGGKGYTDTGIDGSEGYPEYYGSIVKISQSGEQLWAKSLEIVDGGEGWEVTGLTVDSNDDIIAIQDSFGGGLVTKINSAGEKIWRKAFLDDPMGMYDGSITTDEDDNIYVVASMSSAYSLADDLQILKIASDGHLVWQRSLGTWANENTSWYDPSKTLVAKNGMLYISGNTDGAGNNLGAAIALPTDGDGVGIWQDGNWHYQETNWETWGNFTATSTVTNLVISSTSTSLTVTTSTSFTSTSSDWTVVTTPILYGFGGEIVGIKSLTFDDGTVQTSASQGLVRSAEKKVRNGNDVYLRLEHAGQFIVFNNSDAGQAQTCDVYIPHNDDIAFPIGTEITFVKDERTQKIRFWPANDSSEIYLVPAGLDPYFGYYNDDPFDGGEGWAVVGNSINNSGPYGDGEWETPGIAKLLKIDTNRWMLTTTPGLDIIQD